MGNLTRSAEGPPGRRGPSSVRRPLRSSTPRPVLPTRVPRTRFPERPDWPDPQSQSLSRSYGSRLPISLTHIHLSTRGSKPRRPDAEMGTVCVETGSPTDGPTGAQRARGPAAPDSDPCDFLTCIFHGLALVHGTTQELCRSTATVRFAIPSPPSRFIGFPGITGPKTEKKTLPRTRRQWTQARSRCQESSHT